MLRVMRHIWGISAFSEEGCLSPVGSIRQGEVFVVLESWEKSSFAWSARILSPRLGICWIRRAAGKERTERVGG
jgi:hypothetical protein